VTTLLATVGVVVSVTICLGCLPRTSRRVERSSSRRNPRSSVLASFALVFGALSTLGEPTYAVTAGSLKVRVINGELALPRSVKECASYRHRLILTPRRLPAPDRSRVVAGRWQPSSVSVPMLGRPKCAYDRAFMSTTAPEFVATNTPGALADDARFVVDSTGSTTLRVRGPNGWVDVSAHAAERMTGRGLSIEAVESTLKNPSFPYWHEGAWKTGYYDPSTRAFVGTVNGQVTTVIGKASPNYINNLKAAHP
jgi:hypothetical protein